MPTTGRAARAAAPVREGRRPIPAGDLPDAVREDRSYTPTAATRGGGGANSASYTARYSPFWVAQP